MKIIKQGKIKKYAREFTCCKCGCVFIAEKGEWRIEPDRYQEIVHCCGCPCCGEITIRSKLIEE